MKLNQVIAIEKGIKSRKYSEVSELHKISQKPELFNGFSKTYKKKDEEGEDYPAEKKKVQITAQQQIVSFSKALTEIIDITATKDYSNCQAVADIVVDGEVIAKDAPATFILFLEKEINDIRTFVEKLPILDEAEDWTMDVNSGMYKTEPITTHRTKKITKPIELAPATKEHPAQVQLVNEDVVVGYWDTIKHSGSLPAPKKKEMLERIEKLSTAVKCAREKANTVESEDKHVGINIFKYLFT